MTTHTNTNTKRKSRRRYYKPSELRALPFDQLIALLDEVSLDGKSVFEGLEACCENFNTGMDTSYRRVVEDYVCMLSVRVLGCEAYNSKSKVCRNCVEKYFTYDICGREE
jgi:hypothetical protein